MSFPTDLQQQWWNSFFGEFLHYSMVKQSGREEYVVGQEIFFTNSSVDSSTLSEDGPSLDSSQDATYIQTINNSNCILTNSEINRENYQEKPEQTETFHYGGNKSLNAFQMDDFKEGPCILDLSRSEPHKYSKENITNSLFGHTYEPDQGNMELICYSEMQNLQSNKEFNISQLEASVSAFEPYPFINDINTTYSLKNKETIINKTEFTKNIYIQDENHSEVLDLSVRKNENNQVSKENRQMKQRNNHLILDDIVCTGGENSLPGDLPDLRFSEIRRNLSNISMRSKAQKWIYSVRRRVLKLPTVKKMFGFKEDDTLEISLLYGGRGLKNPLKSNIPPFANHADRERKYRCIFCTKEFKNTKILSRHYTQHTTYRKYFCVVCWKGFYDSYDLRRHLEQHEEITVFYCELCEAIFTQNLLKEIHNKNIHSNVYQMGINYNNGTCF